MNRQNSLQSKVIHPLFINVTGGDGNRYRIHADRGRVLLSTLQAQLYSAVALKFFLSGSNAPHYLEPDGDGFYLPWDIPVSTYFAVDDRELNEYRQQSYMRSPVPQQQPGFNQQQPGYNQQQPRFNQQQPRFNQQQPGFNQQQPGFNQQQPGFNQQPGYNQQQPGYNQQQPGFNQQQPGYNQQQPGYNQPVQHPFRPDSRRGRGDRSRGRGGPYRGHRGSHNQSGSPDVPIHTRPESLPSHPDSRRGRSDRSRGRGGPYRGHRGSSSQYGSRDDLDEQAAPQTVNSGNRGYHRGSHTGGRGPSNRSGSLGNLNLLSEHVPQTDRTRGRGKPRNRDPKRERNYRGRSNQSGQDQVREDKVESEWTRSGQSGQSRDSCESDSDQNENDTASNRRSLEQMINLIGDLATSGGEKANREHQYVRSSSNPQGACAGSERDGEKEPDEMSVFRILVKEFNGIASYQEIIRKCPRHLFRDNTSMISWFRNHRNSFNIFEKEGKLLYASVFCRQLTLCLYYTVFSKDTECKKGKDCSFFHVCKDFIVGTCSHKDCRYSHNFKDDVNRPSMEKLGLDEFTNEEIRIIASVRFPTICQKFTNKKSICQAGEDCFKLHYCDKAILKQCNKGDDCTLGHSFETEHNAWVLRSFRMNKSKVSNVSLSVFVSKQAPQQNLEITLSENSEEEDSCDDDPEIHVSENSEVEDGCDEEPPAEVKGNLKIIQY